MRDTVILFFSDRPPPDFLDRGISAIPRPELFYTHRVLGIARKLREEPLKGMDGAIKDVVLSLRTALHRGDDIINIPIKIGADILCLGMD